MLKCFDSKVCFAGDLFENLGCGLCPDEGFKAEAGALPPLHQSRLPRTVTLRSPKWFEDMITVSVVHWLMLENGWTFADGSGVVPDTVNHARFLHQIYTAADSHSAA